MRRRPIAVIPARVPRDLLGWPRRAARATRALLRDLYHLLRLCPRCRAGERYRTLTQDHARTENVRLEPGATPRLRAIDGGRR